MAWLEALQTGFLKGGKLALSRNQAYLGLDIGTASIKVVEVNSDEKKIALKNYGSLEVRGHLDKLNEAIQTSSLEVIETDTAELVRSLIGRIRPGAKNVIASLPAFCAFTSLIELPKMKDEETAQAVEYQAKSLVPIPIENIHIDWTRVGSGKGPDGSEQQQIFLIAVSKKYLERYSKIFSLAGLNLKALELETVALARALTSGDSTLSLIVDIGARSTAIAVAQNGLLLHSSQSDFAGSSLTQAVSRGLGINIKRAEELKKQKGLLGQGGEYEVSTLMLPYLDVILNEAKRTKEVYEKTHGAKVGRVILSGGGSKLLGIEKRASTALQVPIVKAEPFGQVVSFSTSLAPIIKEIEPSFCVALGLSMRGLK